MCRSCRMTARNVKFDFQCRTLYHDYVKSSAFTKPDLSKKLICEDFWDFRNNFHFPFSLLLQPWIVPHDRIQWTGHVARDPDKLLATQLSDCGDLLHGSRVPIGFRSNRKVCQ